MLNGFIFKWGEKMFAELPSSIRGKSIGHVWFSAWQIMSPLSNSNFWFRQLF